MATSSRQEPFGKVRTKIVATLGPASRDLETIASLVDAGVDVFRLNFSHGSHEEHAETLRRVRAIAADKQRRIAVLQDLGGPKIRLGNLAGDAVDCGQGDVFTLRAEALHPDDPRELTCTYPALAEELKAGDDVYFADGAVAMVVTETAPARATLRVTLPGRIRSRQGINLPGTALSVRSLTPKDLEDLSWTAANPVEFVGLSFVRQGADVTDLRRELTARGVSAGIVAKIEKPQAVQNLRAIVAEADAIMVARGDLGVEIDVARVPAIQKQIIAACRSARIPVITATQMLGGMETSNRPTRAEATDVFNAVLDGTDAVMLSGETAVGAYPVEAVDTMSRIAREAEAYLLGNEDARVDGRAFPSSTETAAAGRVQPITDGILAAVEAVCREIDARLVVVATKSGRTALALAKRRCGTPTLALTDDPRVASSMALYWGVTPLLYSGIADHHEATRFAREYGRNQGLVSSGDTIVVVQGTMPNHPSHNAMVVEVVD